MTAGYLAGRTWQGLCESPSGTLVAVASLALALFAAGALFASGLLASRLLSAWGGELRLTVYLDDSAPPAARDAAAARLARFGPVRATGKAEALAELRGSLGSLGGVLDDLPENPLRDTLSVGIARLSPALVAAQAKTLSALPGVAGVDYGGDLFAPAQRLLRVSRRAGLAVVAVVLLATVVLVGNTFRLSVYARREEIGILQLVGATNLFIRLPFLLEGLVEGACAGLLAAAGLAAAWIRLWPRAVASVSLLASLGPHPLPVVPSLAGLVAAGALLGLAASGLSAGRFLGR